MGEPQSGVVLTHLKGSIAHFQFVGTITDDLFEDYERKFRSLYAEGGRYQCRFGLIFDCRGMQVPLLSIMSIARRQTALLRSLEHMSARRVVGSVVIITHPLVRRLIEMVIRMRKSVAPQLVCSDERQGFDWLTALIRRHESKLRPERLRSISETSSSVSALDKLLYVVLAVLMVESATQGHRMPGVLHGH